MAIEQQKRRVIYSLLLSVPVICFSNSASAFSFKDFFGKVASKAKTIVQSNPQLNQIYQNTRSSVTQVADNFKNSAEQYAQQQGQQYLGQLQQQQPKSAGQFVNFAENSVENFSSGFVNQMQDTYQQNQSQINQTFDKTRSGLAQTAQGYVGVASQYAQQQGQQVLLNAQQNKPQNFQGARSFAESSLTGFGEGLFNQMQNVYNMQSGSGGMSFGQRLPLVYGQLNGGITMYGSKLQQFIFPFGPNNTQVPAWSNEVQALMNIITQINQAIQSNSQNLYVPAINSFMTFAQKHADPIYILAFQQRNQFQQPSFFPGNVNWDYLVIADGRHFDHRGNQLQTSSQGYSDQNIMNIEQKRFAMANVVADLYGLVINNGNLLQQVDPNAPQQIMNVIDQLSELEPNHQHVDYYMSVAENQKQAIPLIVSQNGNLKPENQNWNQLADGQGNLYNLKGILIQRGAAQQQTSVQQPQANPFGTQQQTSVQQPQAQTVPAVSSASSNPFM